MKKPLKTLELKMICFLGVVFLFSSCSDDDKTSECGCNSETKSNIPNDETQAPIEDQIKGLLYYKTPENTDQFLNDPKFNNQFWIFQGIDGCVNCQRHFIICNEDFLGNEFDFLKNNNDSIPVRFTGELKYLCTEPFIAPADYFYSGIKVSQLN